MSPTTNSTGQKQSLFEGVTLYHWLVVVIASCGWLFDCMDQRLFTLARESALKELLGSNAEALRSMKTYIGIATAAMMVGWGTGGIIFGMMSDKWGRVKTMVMTLIVYSGFTGLSAFSQSWIDFTVYRFLVGLGVGGMFGSATTLVAESVPGRFRAVALGSLQALSALGNIIGSLLTLQIPPGAEGFMTHYSGWRALFLVGILPSLLVVPIMFVLKEPEPWKKAKAEAASKAGGGRIGSPLELFRDNRWRRSTVVGLFLGLSGMVGLWGIGFFSPELITTALKVNPLEAKDLNDPAGLFAAFSDTNNTAAAHIKKRLTPQVVSHLEKQGASLPRSVQLPGTNGVNDSKSPNQGAAPAIPLELRQELANDLNRLVQGESIYDNQAFTRITLKKGTADLVQQVQKNPQKADIAFLNRQLVEQTFPGAIAGLQKEIDTVRGRAMALQDVGSFLGMMVFTFVAAYLNRRKAFFGAFTMCFFITMFVFYSLKTEMDAYWMLPLMGFAQLAVFAGYSIYFPELYPTRLRGTGVGFCYNTVRYLAAPFPILLGYLSSLMSFRNAAIIMSSIYLVGLVALIWAPETKDRPLPEG